MFRNLRISTKLLLTVLPLVIAAAGVSAWLNNLQQEKEMLNQAQTAARNTSDLIRESLFSMMSSRGIVDDAYLLRLNTIQDMNRCQIRFYAEHLHLRATYLDSIRFRRLEDRQKNNGPMTQEEQNVFATGSPYWNRNGRSYEAIVPFVAANRCLNCHDVPVGTVLGVASMDLSIDRMLLSAEKNWIRSIWIVYIFTSAALFVSIIVYRIVVAKRLKKLVEATHLLGEGNLDLPFSVDDSEDEIGELSAAFEAMRARLRTAQSRLVHSERLSAIGQMAGSIIHDFRTPMATINLLVESLQSGKQNDPAKVQEWYRLIRDAVHRMVTMAQELLDFSKGETHLSLAEFSVDEFLTLVEKTVRFNLERVHVGLEIEREYSGPGLFDPDRLHRAIVNIVNNAQDAMPGGGTVRIRSFRKNGQVGFDISDTGTGIPDQVRETLFEAFVTAGKKKGTGLGLAITKRIIDQHGGTIEVATTGPTGTTFRILLPVDALEG